MQCTCESGSSAPTSEFNISLHGAGNPTYSNDNFPRSVTILTRMGSQLNKGTVALSPYFMVIAAELFAGLDRAPRDRAHRP